jgi:hypothetical protein
MKSSLFAARMQSDVNQGKDGKDEEEECSSPD